MKMKSGNSNLPARKRILVVDDHPLIREGLAQWINRESDLEICGEAELQPMRYSWLKNSNRTSCSWTFL